MGFLDDLRSLRPIKKHIFFALSEAKKKGYDLNTTTFYGSEKDLLIQVYNRSDDRIEIGIIENKRSVSISLREIERDHEYSPEYNS